MRTFWIVQAGIGVAALGASAGLGVACDGTIVGTDTATETETDTATETETDIETDTDTGSSWPAFTCYECACMNTSSDAPAGCADTCDNGGVGSPTTPNFCNGAPALTMCKMCIAARCGVDDPTQCSDAC